VFSTSPWVTGLTFKITGYDYRKLVNKEGKPILTKSGQVVYKFGFTTSIGEFLIVKTMHTLSSVTETDPATRQLRPKTVPQPLLAFLQSLPSKTYEKELFEEAAAKLADKTIKITGEPYINSWGRPEQTRSFEIVG